MTQIAQGNTVRRTVGLLEEHFWHPGAGLVATDGVVYTPVATFGTTAVDIFNELVDPGFPMRNFEIEVGLTQRFVNVTDAVGSLIYTWTARVEALGTTKEWIGISPTLSKGIGSLANSTDTLSGYLGAGSLPESPIRIRLQAIGLIASSMTGQLRNSSFVRLFGAPIPGV